MRSVPDVRRWAATRAYGTMRFLDGVQGALEDVEGALQAGQYGVAAFQARYAVLVCLSIRSLPRGGEIDFSDESVSFDFFAGLDEREVAAGLELARDAVDLDAEAASDWLQRLRAYVAATEAELGFDGPLPVMRSPEGMFGVIALARRWASLLDDLGLPPLLPVEWTGGPTDGQVAR